MQKFLFCLFQLYVVVILCYCNAFRVQTKKLPFLQPLYNDLTPRTDREIYYQSLQKKGIIFSSAFILQLARPKKAEAAGYQAAPSAFAPNDFLYTAPLLPQSALLNSLPIKVYIYLYVYVYLRVYICIHVCLCVCMYKYVCVYVYMYKYICIYTYTYIG
jgi:hypothetical protein